GPGPDNLNADFPAVFVHEPLPQQTVVGHFPFPAPPLGETPPGFFTPRVERFQQLERRIIAGIPPPAGLVSHDLSPLVRGISANSPGISPGFPGADNA